MHTFQASLDNVVFLTPLYLNVSMVNNSVDSTLCISTSPFLSHSHSTEPFPCQLVPANLTLAMARMSLLVPLRTTSTKTRGENSVRPMLRPPKSATNRMMMSPLIFHH